MIYQTPPPAIIQPWHTFRSASAVIAAAVSEANHDAALNPYQRSRRGLGHLGERQRVNLYNSRGGGKRRNR